MRRGAQGVGCQLRRRAQLLRDLIYRVCLSEAPTARRELRGTPQARAPQVAPQRSEGDAVSRGAFAWVTFILRKMKVTAPPGAQPGICAKRRNPQTNSCYQKQSPSPSRTGVNSSFYLNNQSRFNAQSQTNPPKARRYKKQSPPLSRAGVNGRFQEKRRCTLHKTTWRGAHG